MLHKIRIYGNEILNKKTKKVEVIDDEIKKLLDDMVETMLDAPGVGLAGPQVGLDKSMFVYGVDEDDIRKVINPEIIGHSKEEIDMEEGCLSIPGIYKNVKRPERIKVRYQNENSEWIEQELDGMMARIFQHEYDHLLGELFVEKIGPVGKKLIASKLKKLKKISGRM